MIKRIALFFLTLATPVLGAALAEDAHDHHESEHEDAFNPSNYIIHHIADAHDIHLWGEGHSAVHIPLPIIVYSEAYGLDVFMSSAFEGHGDVRVAERPSGATYALSHGHIALEDNHDSHAGHNHGDHDGHDHGDHNHGDHAHHGPVVYDFSITKSIFGMLLMLGLMVALFGRMAGSYKNRQGQAPTGLTNALEPMVLFLRDEIAIPNIGEKRADQFLPFLMTVFFFIFFAFFFLIPLLMIAGPEGSQGDISALCFRRKSVAPRNKHEAV